ncbi:MAG: CHAT domain-containing protein [Pseudomonadota bacterium]
MTPVQKRCIALLRTPAPLSVHRAALRILTFTSPTAEQWASAEPTLLSLVGKWRPSKATLADATALLNAIPLPSIHTALRDLGGLAMDTSPLADGADPDVTVALAAFTKHARKAGYALSGGGRPVASFLQFTADDPDASSVLDMLASSEPDAASAAAQWINSSLGSSYETGASAPDDDTPNSTFDDSEETALEPADENTARTAPPDDDAAIASDEPRQAFAKLDCPDAVVPETWFDVDVGLSPRPSQGVVGGPMTLPAELGQHFEITVRLLADGFEVHAEDRLSVTLQVTSENAYPSAVIRLRATDNADFGAARALMAQFSVNGQMIGAAARTVDVNAQARRTTDEARAGGVDMAVPPAELAPDLTITITKGNTERADRLIWALDSPHAELDVAPPDAPSEALSDVGNEPGLWARNLMNEVHKNAGDPSSLTLTLKGKGRDIASLIPIWVRRVLYQLSTLSDTPATVLIVSNEPNIPWELAWLELHNQGAGENFLGAEFAVGRWVIGHVSAVTNKSRPEFPPPVQIGVRRMAVVSGDYSATRGWKDLAGAHEEADALASRFNAQKVNADGGLGAWLDRVDDVDLIHFAVHGKWDLTGANEGIALTNGNMLTPSMIKGARMRSAPFVFLNACQVGQGEETLAGYGGVAAAFLDAGARGVIAALWNVDDQAARNMALAFYDSANALKAGASEFIRGQRARFPTVADDSGQINAPSLLLAYQFFGHPRLRLELDL